MVVRLLLVLYVLLDTLEELERALGKLVVALGDGPKVMSGRFTGLGKRLQCIAKKCAFIVDSYHGGEAGLRKATRQSSFHQQFVQDLFYCRSI